MTISSQFLPNSKLKEESTPQLSIIIPVYNKQREIERSLEKLKRVLDSTFVTYQLIVVNDGSVDNTLKVLREEEKLDSRVQVISLPENRGKGNAVKMGVLQAQGELSLFIDGDLDINPEVLENYFKEADNYDLIIASKSHPLSKVNASTSRMLLSRLFNLVVRISTGIKIGDTQSGMKVGKTLLLKRIFKIMSVKRYAFDVELLTLATAFGLRIREMPLEVNLHNRFKVREIAIMMRDIAVIFYKHRITKSYKKQVEESILEPTFQESMCAAKMETM